MQYRSDNTEGYDNAALDELNRIYEHRIALLDEEEREDLDYLQHVSEEVLSDYDMARDRIPDAICIEGDEGGDDVRVSAIRDLRVRTPGAGATAAGIVAVALVDLEEDDLPGVVLVIYPDGEILAQRDWQSPVDAIPQDLSEIQWPNNVIVCGDGLPRYLPSPLI